MLIASGATARADYYKKVTSSSDLVVGGTYILAALDSTTNCFYVATKFTDKYLESTNTGFELKGDMIIPNGASFLEYTLGGSTSGYTLKNGANYLWLKNTGSTDLTVNKDYGNNLAKWTYTYKDQYKTYTNFEPLLQSIWCS